MAKKQEDKYKPRADGRYHTQVSTGKYDDDGKPIRIPLYASTSKKLETLVNDVKYEIKHGTYAHDKGILFGEYAKKWLTVSKAAKGIQTKAMYQNIIDNHIELLEDKKLSNIKRSDIQLQINSNLELTRICEQQVLTIKQVFKCAVEDGMVNKNPCTDIELPRRIPKEKRPLTDIEKKALKEADFTDIEKAFIFILYGCGVRPGEMYALTKKDINIKERELTINKALTFEKNKPVTVPPKTDDGIRIIPIPNITLSALETYMNEIGTFILFSDKNGNYRTKAGYANVFNQILKKMKIVAGEKPQKSGNSNKEIYEVKIEGLTPYVFRHNYCTELYYSDVSLKEAQRLMGHSDYKMILEVYSHLDEKKENTKEKIKNLAL